MREEWSFRKRNLPTITTKTIDRIVADTRRKGALAGKVCGAGGGGCVVLLIEPDTRERVEAAVVEAGGGGPPLKIHRSGGAGDGSFKGKGVSPGGGMFHG